MPSISSASHSEKFVSRDSYDSAVYQAMLALKGCSDPMVWRKHLVSSGNSQIDIPLHMGGRGFSSQQMAEVFFRFGQLDVELRDVPGAGHARLLIYTEKENVADLLAPICDGDWFFGIAMTEEQAGSDLTNLKTRASRSGSGFTITGKKKFNGRMLTASHFIVLTQADSDISKDGLALFLVPSELAQKSTIDGMGHSNFSWGSMQINQVELPPESRLDSVIPAHVILQNHFSYWRTMIASVAIGCAEYAIRLAKMHMSKRQIQGRRLAEMSHLQRDLAFHFASIKSTQLLRDWVLNSPDCELSPSKLSSMVKAESVERAISAVDFAMNVHGALGYSSELSLEKRYRDLMGLRFADGASDALRCSVGRAICKEYLSADHFEKRT